VVFPRAGAARSGPERAALALRPSVHDLRLSPGGRGMSGLGPRRRRGGQEGVEEAQRRADRFVPPLDQRLVKPGGGAQLRGEPGGYRDELAALGLQQVPRIGAGPGQQGQLEQQFGADITGMGHGLAQPAGGGPVPLGGDGQPGPRWSQLSGTLISQRRAVTK